MGSVIYTVANRFQTTNYFPIGGHYDSQCACTHTAIYFCKSFKYITLWYKPITRMKRKWGVTHQDLEINNEIWRPPQYSQVGAGSVIHTYHLWESGVHPPMKAMTMLLIVYNIMQRPQVFIVCTFIMHNLPQNAQKGRKRHRNYILYRTTFVYYEPKCNN